MGAVEGAVEGAAEAGAPEIAWRRFRKSSSPPHLEGFLWGHNDHGKEDGNHYSIQSLRFPVRGLSKYRLIGRIRRPRPRKPPKTFERPLFKSILCKTNRM